MYTHAPSSYRCPFCLVAAGCEDPAVATRQADVVLRRDLALAFIAADWRPNNPGHVLVIPTLHYENLYALPFEAGAQIQAVVREVALAMKRAYGCAGVSTVQHNEPAGNQDVWHYHVHVFPRYPDDDLYRSPKRPTTPDERAPYAEWLQHELTIAGNAATSNHEQSSRLPADFS
jgi:histidine triad (HIT) family protein